MLLVGQFWSMDAVYWGEMLVGGQKDVRDRLLFLLFSFHGLGSRTISYLNFQVNCYSIEHA